VSDQKSQYFYKNKQKTMDLFQNLKNKFFGSKPSLNIACPECDWQPDADAIWECTCGHCWNTFDTKGKCPKCATQWSETYCHGCGSSPAHSAWYIDPSAPAKIDTPETALLKARKKRIEQKLITLGIKNYRIKHLPYLDYDTKTFQTPYEIGCRIIILSTMSYASHALNERPDLMVWLTNQNLWDKVSPREHAFLIEKEPNEDLLIDMSWRIEAALVLGWALDIINNLHDIDNATDRQTLDYFLKKIPAIGSDTRAFLQDLKYRNTDEVFEENILNEMATTYFRDLMFNGQNDATNINRATSFERHQALNWLRQYDERSDWDDTDTST
jgi:Domain of unknown function (DUF4272)